MTTITAQEALSKDMAAILLDNGNLVLILGMEGHGHRPKNLTLDGDEVAALLSQLSAHGETLRKMRDATGDKL